METPSIQEDSTIVKYHFEDDENRITIPEKLLRELSCDIDLSDPIQPKRVSLEYTGQTTSSTRTQRKWGRATSCGNGDLVLNRGADSMPRSTTKSAECHGLANPVRSGKPFPNVDIDNPKETGYTPRMFQSRSVPFRYNTIHSAVSLKSLCGRQTLSPQKPSFIHQRNVSSVRKKSGISLTPNLELKAQCAPMNRQYSTPQLQINKLYSDLPPIPGSNTSATLKNTANRTKSIQRANTSLEPINLYTCISRIHNNTPCKPISTPEPRYIQSSDDDDDFCSTLTDSEHMTLNSDKFVNVWIKSGALPPTYSKLYDR